MKKTCSAGMFTKVWKETVKQRMKLTKALFREQESEAEVECVWFNNPTIAERVPLFQPVLHLGKGKIGVWKNIASGARF
jgi:hypothetical protein